MDIVVGAPVSRARHGTMRPDFVLVGSVTALAALGLLMIFSASIDSVTQLGIGSSPDAQRQLVFILIGAGVFTATSLLEERPMRLVAPITYLAVMVLLLLVLTPIGTEVRGAQRWLQLGSFQLQPSELAKPALILSLAALLGSDPDEQLPWRRIVQTIAVMLPLAALVAIQPDLGTTIVFLFIAPLLLFMAGASLRQLGGILLVGAAGLLVAMQAGLFAFKDYQIARLTAFLDPAADQLTLNYNQLQSKLTIGSGGLLGKGLFEGDQTNLSFVPHQTTDFIFTAVGEQLGFLGAAIVIGLFAVIVWRLLMIAATANSRFGRLYAAGAAGLVAFHVFVNIGMTVGMLPVTGLPLPFMSQGGSSFIAMMAVIGLAHSFRIHRSPVPGERRLL
ncbi:MAG: rod shape-determining protein RodA [Acidimicrobiia bacterium]